MSSDSLHSPFPDGAVRPLFLLFLTHITAVIGVVTHTGIAVGGLGADSQQLTTPIWDVTIGAWLVSLVAVGVALIGDSYQTRAWQLATYILSVVTAVGVITVVYVDGSGAIYTDVMLFMRYAADLAIDGINPYVASMDPAFQRYQSALELPSVTRRADGSRVSNISYPALSFLIFVPQRWLGITNISVTVVVCFALCLLFFVREAPYWLFTTSVTVLFFNQYVVANAVFGNIDFVWILPLLIGMHYWHRGYLLPATFAVGVAFAVKPIAWFIAPFTAIWLWVAPERFGHGRLVAVAVALLGGFTGFLIPNLPYLIDAPTAWILDNFSAVGSRGSFQTRGTGLAIFSFSGILPMPTTAFRVILVTVFAGAAGMYYRYFDHVKWVAWVMPAFLLWFNDRALFNYFITFIPIAYYAMLLNRGLVPKRPLLPLATVRNLPRRVAVRTRSLFAKVNR